MIKRSDLGTRGMGVRFLYCVGAILVAFLMPLVAPSGAQTIKSVPLPLVKCPTIHGSDSEPKALPATKLEPVPPGISERLAVYSDSEGELFLIAPRGWGCQASIGADGNDYLSIYPHGEVVSAKPFALRKWPGAAEAVTGDLLPICMGCYLEQACGFFPAAERDFVASYGRVSICPRRSVGEDVRRISSTVVTFDDPAGVLGTGSPSGGLYSADGVVTFKRQSANGIYGSSTETCTLPPRDQTLCVVVRNAFVARWYGYVLAK
jgi:hypothetical protein